MAVEKRQHACIIAHLNRILAYHVLKKTIAPLSAMNLMRYIVTELKYFTENMLAVSLQNVASRQQKIVMVKIAL